MKKHGLLKTVEGQTLLTIIKANMNSKRYNNNNIIDIKLVYNMFNMHSIYDISQTHETNYRCKDYDV